MSTLTDSLRARVRERQLAGDGRAGVWARDRARDIHWRWLQQQWRSVALPVTVLIGGVSVIAYFMPSRFVGGLLVGAVSAGMLGALAMIMVLVTGTAYRTMGSIAETWTASVLRPLRRAGWRIANHVMLGKSDIDHVLIGPTGVLAVETKWSTSPWILDPPSPKVREAITQAQRNATILKYWHPLKSVGLREVGSVVFLWGFDDNPEDRPARPVVIDGTVVVVGNRAAKAWRSDVTAATGALEPGRAVDYWRAIDAQIRIRDAHDVVHEAPKPSLSSMLWQAVGTLSAALSTVYAFGEALRLRPVPLAVAAVAGMAGLGVLARRVRPTRIIALGWLTGLALCLVALGGLEVAVRI